MIRVEQLEVGPMSNYAYLLCDAAAGACAVVDPGWDAPKILAAARAQGCSVAAVLLTHHHFDHSNEVPSLVRAAPAPVYVHRADAGPVRPKAPDLREVSDGDRMKVGRCEVEFLHTPGHTRGSQCLRAGRNLLTGDTLFLGACGRVDLEDSDPEQMTKSLRRLAGLPGTLTVWPGHAYGPAPSGPLSVEIATNPYMLAAIVEGKAGSDLEI
ncbi:MAG: MBL fold metallo-hydrolase [Elusimicrobiota bacterium]|jgi:glyoxylase-like metal-dependent hydrolase (beta-lactamase superfamily II)